MIIKECDLINKNKVGIYCITNLINSKKYVGQTSMGFIYRWRDHLKDLIKLKHGNSYLQKSWNKYGEDNFEFSILEIIEPTEDKEKFKKLLNEKEQYWIDYYDVCNRDKGYNICPKAGTSLGIKRTDNFKEKQRKVWTEEKRKKRAEYCKLHYSGQNNPMSGTIRKGINRGKKNGQSKAVILFNINDEIINQFDTVHDCVKYLNDKLNFNLKTDGMVSRCCNHKKCTIRNYGYYTLFLEEYNNERCDKCLDSFGEEK